MNLLLVIFANVRAQLKIKPFFALLSIAFYAGIVTANDCFDDKNLYALSQLASQNQRGTLIYVWSPRMVYSVYQMALASRMAAANGLAFIVVHDMRVSSKELLEFNTRPAIFQNSGQQLPEETDLATPPFIPLTDSSQPLCSATLLANEALRHFPTSFIVTAQGVHPHPIVGAMPQAAWMTSIAQRLRP